MGRYIIGIDQSTQGTKALLVDEGGHLIHRADRSHRQIVNEAGWVSHDPAEIAANVLAVARAVVEETGVDPADVAGIGISNQRETDGSGTLALLSGGQDGLDSRERSRGCRGRGGG